MALGATFNLFTTAKLLVNVFMVMFVSFGTSGNHSGGVGFTAGDVV